MKNMMVINKYLKQLISVCICLAAAISCSDHRNDVVTDTSPPKETTTVSGAAAISEFNNNSVTSIGNSVLSILQDKGGNYWFGTNEGVFRYNNIALIKFTAKDSLAQNQVLDIQEDNAGNVWFTTGGYGVSRFDGKHINTLTGNDKPGSAAGNVWKTQKDDLWFYAGGGSFRYADNSFCYLSFPVADNASGRTAGSAYKVSPYSVYSALKDKNGHVWFGTQSKGVCCYDGKNFKWFTDKGLAGPAVLTIFEDKNGKLWFGTNGRGVICYDGKVLTNFTEEAGLGNPDFIRSNKQGPGTLARVWTICEDAAGDLLMGTGEGEVWKYNGRDRIMYGRASGLPGAPIECIYKDRNGKIWIGTNGDGVYTFNGVSFEKFLPRKNNFLK